MIQDSPNNTNQHPDNSPLLLSFVSNNNTHKDEEVDQLSRIVQHYSLVPQPNNGEEEEEVVELHLQEVEPYYDSNTKQHNNNNNNNNSNNNNNNSNYNNNKASNDRHEDSEERIRYMLNCYHIYQRGLLLISHGLPTYLPYQY